MGFSIHRPFKVTFLAALLTSVAPIAVFANPVDGVVAAGSASTASVGNTLTVNQSSDKAIIDWRGFDIAADETTNFVQPSSHALTLNRVGSGGASQIYGTLTANGNIIIVNPNGVVFGAGSHVDVNSLVATTANASNADVMAGKFNFNQPGNPNATIENRGFISAKDEGLVGLVAPNVLNSGVITAKLGRIHLASGDTATVDLYGDGLIEVQASDALAHQLVENTGTLAAEGGTIAMTAAAGRETVDSLVHVSGLLDARSIGTKNGQIYIYAEGSNAVAGNVAANKGKKTGTSTVVVENALLDASGRNPGEHGGKITITADNVALLAGTVLDASGYEGLSNTTANGKLSDVRFGAAGGDIQVGGDYLGGSITPTALNLYVDSSVVVMNDAIESGDAGRTIFWSDGITQFYGNVYARALGGQPVDPVTWNATPAAIIPGRRMDEGMGGFVETSGHAQLDAGGYVDLTASSGNKGSYFLDPTNITIYGNFAPNYATVIQGDATTLASSLKLWLDASDTANVNLTYNSLGTTATGTGGTNTITVGSSAGLVVGERVQVGGSSGTQLASVNDTSNIYTITAISGSTITLDANLASSAAAVTLYGGYVSQLTDKSGNTNNATQAAAANMPLWISNGQNGLGVASLNGTSDGFSVNLNFLAGSSFDVFFALKTTNYANVFGATNGNAGSNSLHVGFENSSNYRENYWSDDYYPPISSAFTSGASNIVEWQWINNATKSVYANGHLEGTISEPGIIGVPSGGGNISNNVVGQGFWGGSISEATFYSTGLSTNAQALVNQYQSAKWGIALTGPGNATGEAGLTGAEAQSAMASTQAGATTDGYSVFTTRYLNRLSQNSNIILQASNNINLDLQGDTLSLAAGKNLTLTAGNQIATASNGAITTSNGAITLNATNGIAINNNFALNSGGGVININSPTAIANGATLTLNDGGSNNSISSIISGAGSVTKAGAGTLTLSGANTYTGATTVNAGTLNLSGSWNVGAGTATTSVASGATLSGAGVITAATLSDNGAGTVNLTGNNLITTLATTGSIGDFTLNNAQSFTSGAITTAGNSVNLSASGAGNNIATTGAIATGTAGNITLTADDLILGANLSGTGTVTLKPYTATQGMHVGGAYTGTSAGYLTLSQTEIGYLVDGWSSIALGRNTGYVAGGGLITVDSSNWYDPLSVYGNNGAFYTGTINFYGNGSLTSSSGGGSNSANGNITTAGGNILISGNFGPQGSTFTTNGGSFTVSYQTFLSSGATFTLQTGNGNVIFDSGNGGSDNAFNSGNAASNVIINAGTGSLALNGQLGINTAANITATASSITTSGPWGNTTPLGSVTLTSANSIALPSITANNILVQTTGATSDITLNAGSTLTASGTGNSLVLASGRNFINNSNSSALSAASGRWLVYSADPANNTRGGLMPDATDFNETYAGNAPATIGAGNRFVFSRATAPTVTLTVNNDSVTYGNSYTPNPGYSYTSGLVGGDAWGNIGLSGAASYGSSYVQGGTNASVTPYSGMITATTGSLVDKLGYVFAFTAGDLTVNQRSITASLTGLVSKIYDGTTSATLAGGNYSLSNVYGADAVGVATTAGTYDTATVGSGKMVSVSGMTLNGAKAGNYVLSSTSASGAIGTVNQKALTVTGESASNKTYDGTTTATLSDGSLVGVIASDVGNVSLTEAGTFASKNAGTGIAVTAGDSISGSASGNYSLTQPIIAAANIIAKTLTVTGETANNKTYDGGFTATLTGGSLSGVIAADVGNVSLTEAGSFVSKNVGSGIAVTAGDSISGPASGNYSLIQPIIAADIIAKALTITAGDQNIIYGSAIPADGVSYNGFIAGEDASFLTSAPTVTSAQSGIINAGSYAGNYTASGATSNNYTIGYAAGDLTVDKRILTASLTGTVSKVYDGTNAATLAGTNYSLANVYGVDAVGIATTAGTYDDKNVTTGKTVSVTGLTLNGAKAANYSLASTSVSGAVGTITQKGLTVTAGNRTITYGASVPADTLSYSGFAAGENAGNLTTAPTLSSTEAGTPDAGSYVGNFVVSGGVSGNYSFTYVPGNLTVNTRALLVTTDSKTKLFSAADPIFTGSNNLLAGDAALISWSYAPVGYAGATGDYTIAATPTDASNRLANYTRTNDYGTFTVNPDNYVPFTNNYVPDNVQVLSQDPSSDTATTITHSDLYTGSMLYTDTFFATTDDHDDHYIFLYDHADGVNSTARLDMPHFIQIAPQLQQQLGLQQQAI